MAHPTPSLTVLGGGPGGYAAAFLAADLGLPVTLIDEEANPGGVCLYRGCIPSKALLHVAKLINEAKHAAAWGVTFAPPEVDLDKLRSFKDGVVAKMTGGLGQLSTMRGITYLRGRGTIVDPHTVSVATAKGEQRVKSDYLILSTGSFPTRVPGVSIDSPRVMDSTGALELRDVPTRLLVVGGGYIGLELGSVYAALGSAVTVVEMLDGLLPGADRDLANVLARSITPRFTAVLLKTRVVSLTDNGSSLDVVFDGEVAEKTQQFDKVLVSVGRKPNSKIPGLERTRVQVNGRGFIVVDGQRRTAEPSIFAIGDVAGDPMLAHKASHEGRVAVEVIAGHKAAFEPAAIPAVVFTDPELAWCGITEAEARATGVDVEIARFPWAASGRATTIDRSDGVTKLIIEKATGRVLGMGIVGPGAGELIAEGVLAVEMAATATDVAMSIHPHPTLSETVMESADAYFGTSTHIYRPKKK
jgi:dihydrolipoamide dehydrogenase